VAAVAAVSKQISVLIVDDDASVRAGLAINRWKGIWQRPDNRTSTDRQGIGQQHHAQTAAGWPQLPTTLAHT
jgi:hypothetical protein